MGKSINPMEAQNTFVNMRLASQQRSRWLGWVIHLNHLA